MERDQDPTAPDHPQDSDEHLASDPWPRDPALLPGRVHRHLIRICSRCEEAWRSLSWILRQTYEGILHLAAPEPALRLPREDDLPTGEAALTALRQTEKELQKELRRAKKQLSELRHVPLHRRAGRVKGAYSRFRSHLLAELLIEEARSRVRNEPAEAESFAGLVAYVLDWTRGRDEPPWATRLLARGAAHRANALRVAGDLPAADAAFAALRRDLGRRPLADPLALAEIASLEGSLRIDQRRMEDADALLLRAELSYRYGQNEDGRARTLIKRANLAQHRGQPEPTLRFLREVEDMGFEIGERYGASVVAARVAALCDLNRPSEARRHLHDQLHVFEADNSPHTAATLRWLEGRTLLGTGENAAAEKQLRTAAGVFQQLGRSYDAIMAALDLAEALLGQGRSRELARLAAHLSEEFSRREVGPETFEALQLFARATQAEELTAALLSEVRRKLRVLRPVQPPA